MPEALTNWQTWAAVAVIAPVVLSRVWPLVKGYVPSLSSIGSIFGGGDTDAADLEALKRLRKRKAYQSPEAREALKTLSAHFLDEVTA